MSRAPLLVLASVVSVQVGQAFGKQAFGVLEPAGVVTLRLGLAALVLLVVLRPRPPADARTVALVVAFGTAIAGMNLVYPAMQLLPLGIAMSLLLLGPLTLALAGSRHPVDAGWALLAAAGVFLIGRGAGPLPLVGVLLALCAGASMAAYLLLSRRAGTAQPGTLALAVTWAAAVSLPFGISSSGTELVQPRALAIGLLVAVLSAVLPYSLDLAALRRLPPRTVGVLQSLEPVVGALAGLVLLGELLDARQWAAVGCITAASAGAVFTPRRAAGRPCPDPAGTPASAPGARARPSPSPRSRRPRRTPGAGPAPRSAPQPPRRAGC
ncbi:inner membrane transporter RhtA [Pseudonocardia hierapolitana]|uniref:Inner membrane transporter RhtA n=1 Tax=Pseudonocardia hierapolitana TaxID=1128676 RepID=A0A561SZ96_9PSEU|nr:inner membrane transporter RhtA [Pseudonocardia hierapolitana]